MPTIRADPEMIVFKRLQPFPGADSDDTVHSVLS